MEIFSKRLSQTDVSRRLTIPTHALPYFESLEGQDLVVTDWSLRDEWRLHFSTRKKGHARPVFTGEWLRLVKDKGIQANDELKFIQLEDGRHKIELSRETKIFGTKLSGPVL